MISISAVEKMKQGPQELLVRVGIIAICIVLCLISRGTLAGKYSSVDSYKHEIEVLDQQKASAAGLSVASAGASAAITLIPDDACTPIANQLAEISKDLAIVTGAILLEKYLLVVLGYAFFAWLVPLCCALIIVANLMPRNVSFRSPIMVGAIKVLVIGLIAWRSVPISVFVVDMISDTYDITITEAIDNAQKISEEIETDKNEKGEAKSTNNDDGSWLNGFIGSAEETVGAAVDTVLNLTAGKVKELVAWAKVVLTQVTEGFAVLVVTSVAIPLLTPIIMAWMVKTFFQPSAMTSAESAVPALPIARSNDEKEE